MNYEISHVYMDGLIGNEQKFGIDIFNQIKRDGDTSSLMIDDYSFKHGGANMLEFDDIIRFYERYVSLDNISMESDFINVASQFPNHLKTKRERFRKDKKYTTFILLEDMKIKLRDEYDNGLVKYSCPALSASYHMVRSGVMSTSLISPQQERICSILPIEYEHIEHQVGAILREFNCVNTYIFYDISGEIINGSL